MVPLLQMSNVESGQKQADFRETHRFPAKFHLFLGLFLPKGCVGHPRLVVQEVFLAQ